MSGLRGPDSSKDAQLLDNAVFPETVDVNIRQLDPIPAPRYFLKEIPLTDEMSDLVLKSRQEIRDVLNGKDDRLLAIVGPCSIHDPKAAHEYAAKLAAVKNHRLEGSDQRSRSRRPVQYSQGHVARTQGADRRAERWTPGSHGMAGSDHPAVHLRPD